MDIENMPGLAPEVKARRDYQPTTWLRQASRNSPDGALPFVVHRPDGYGPTTVTEWPVTIRLADFAELLLEAGYGSSPFPPAKQETDLSEEAERAGIT